MVEFARKNVEISYFLKIPLLKQESSQKLTTLLFNDTKIHNKKVMKVKRKKKQLRAIIGRKSGARRPSYII